MAVVFGKNVNLYVNNNGWQVVACGRSCSLTTTTEIAERTTSTSGTGKQFKALATSWTCSAEGDISLGDPFTIDDMVKLQLSLAPVMVSFDKDDDTGNTMSFRGRAVIENITQTGELSSAATFTVNLIGDGDFTFSAVPVVNSSEVLIYNYDASGGESELTAPVLVDQNVLLVFDDSHSYKVVNATPGNQEVQYIPSTGTLVFDHFFQGTEKIIVAYQ